MGFMDELKKNIKTGLAYSSEKIQEYSHIGKLKLDIMSKKREVEICNKEIGQKAFELIEGNRGGEIAADALVVGSVARIRSARTAIADLEQQLREASEKKSEKKAV